MVEHIQRADIEALFKLARPKQPRYRALKQALADYSALRDAGGWEQIPAGRTMEPGTSDPRSPLLRKRLQITGDHPADHH